MSTRLVLASASPRRRELLTSLGVDFTIAPADLAEQPRTGERINDYVVRLASEKALAIAHRFPEAFVLGCDTEVELDGDILGKPSGEEEAAAMLRRLAGRTHRVCTGVCLARSAMVLESFAVESFVTFKNLDGATIRAYVSTGEPLDKAGAYGAQGQGRMLIEHIEGSVTNVIGLPVEEVARLLRRHGLLRAAVWPAVGE
ncbi:MAG: Maf family protein [Candidatus Binatia bacterium]|nr:Maf family protein [Candidatus Binatia bacterium]